MPRLLDLFSGAGGAAFGYWQAGFSVVGVDHLPQKRFPFEFHQADALEYLSAHWHEFDAVHASPPCQKFSWSQRIRANDHPDLIGPTRDLLREIGLPYVIENVEGSPLLDPIMLCGAMFDLRTYRHRLFETSFRVVPPDHPDHVAPLAKMGRPVADNEFIHVVGNFSDVELARQAMGIPWMGRNQLKEAIPPAYSRYIGVVLMGAVNDEERGTDYSATCV